MVHLGNDWDEILAGEFEQDYYKRIRYWLKKEYAEQTIYPAADNIFNALRYTPYSKVKAVILGQDPYHGPGQAHGLCFRFSRVFSRLRACRTSSRSCRVILALCLPRTARSPSGRSAVCSC